MEFKSDHAGDILNNLNRERTNSKDFCDFTIKAGNEKFAIHRCVVGSFSKFFKNLLTAEMEEKYSKEATVQFSPTVVELVINFVYTSYVKISMDSVYEVLEASEFLEIPYLKDYCEKVLKKHLNGGNCLKIRTYAKLYQMQEVTQLTESFICDNLSSVLQSEEFCDLAVDDVGSLLDIDNEEPTIDECKFNSLIKWTKHDIDARSSNFSSLFILIDLQWLLSKKFVKAVVLKEKLVQDSSECMNWLVTALADHVPEVLTKGTRKPVHKLAKDEAEDVLLIGGEGCSQSVVKYNINSKQFSDMPECFSPLEGYDGNRATNTAEVFDPNVGNWGNIPSMKTCRIGLCAVVLNQEIFAIGGRDEDKNILSSVEKYNLASQRWSDVSSMKEGRRGGSACVVNGRIYVFGGHPANTVQSYDPEMNEWIIEAKMDKQRYYLSVVSI